MPRSDSFDRETREFAELESLLAALAPRPLNADRRTALFERIMTQLGEQDPTARDRLAPVLRSRWVTATAGAGLAAAVAAAAYAQTINSQSGSAGAAPVRGQTEFNARFIASNKAVLIGGQRTHRIEDGATLVALRTTWIIFGDDGSMGIDAGTNVTVHYQGDAVNIELLGGNGTFAATNSKVVVRGAGWQTELAENSLVRLSKTTEALGIEVLGGSLEGHVDGAKISLTSVTGVQTFSLPRLAGADSAGSPGEAAAPHETPGDLLAPRGADSPAASPTTGPASVNPAPAGNAPGQQVGVETPPVPASQPADSHNTPGVGPAALPGNSHGSPLAEPAAQPSATPGDTPAPVEVPQGLPSGPANGQPNGNSNGENGQGNGNGQGDANGQANGNGNANPNGQANGNANGNPNGQANGNGNGNPNGQANGNGNANGQANGNGNANGRADGNTAANGNGQEKGQGNGNADTNGQGNGNANGQANGQGNVDGQANGQGNGNANGQANGNANSNADANGNANANGQANGQGSGNGEANGNANANGHENANENGNGQGNANANGQAGKNK